MQKKNKKKVPPLSTAQSTRLFELVMETEKNSEKMIKDTRTFYNAHTK